MDFVFKDHYGMDDLLEIMCLLRGEGGCVWDREQDHHSIRNNFLEEAYEAVEAIDREDPVLLREELGDVLLQVVFHARMEEETGRFSFDDVCDGICKKLIYRHPHVFGDVTVENSSQVLDNWDKLKTVEKGQQTTASTLEGVSRALPALTRAAKVQKRAGKVGFDYTALSDAIGDLRSEIAELEEAVARKDDRGVREEIGDVIFSAANVSRLLGADPEEALTRTTEKFIRRFARMEKAAINNDIDLSHCTIAELNDLWREAKKEEKIWRYNIMSKIELVSAVAEKTGLSKKDSEKVVSAVFSTITEELAKGEKFSLVGFGTFEVKERPARPGVNPRTKQPITIAASKSVSFKAGKGLKEAVK